MATNWSEQLGSEIGRVSRFTYRSMDTTYRTYQWYTKAGRCNLMATIQRQLFTNYKKTTTYITIIV